MNNQRLSTSYSPICLGWDSNPRQERSKVKQTNKAKQHPKHSLFLRKMSCLGWDSNPRQERSKVKQTNKAKQHPKHSLFLRKISCLGWDSNPRHSTLYTLHSRQSALPLSYQGSSAGWAQISHLIVHLMNRLTIT